MDIKNAKYTVGTVSGERTCVQATIDGKDMALPIDSNNRHYKELMRQAAEEGLTIADPE